MNELNLEVGQKVWSIQLGKCEVCFKDDEKYTCTNGNFQKEYYLNGRMFHHDHSPSLFESNPFEPKLVLESKDGWKDQSVKPNDMVENKAELINALVRTIEVVDSTEIEKIAQEKIKKVLEKL